MPAIREFRSAGLVAVLMALAATGATGPSVQLAASDLLDAAVDHPVTGDFTPISAIRDPARTVRLFARYRP